MFSTPKDLPVSHQLVIVSIGMAVLAVSQAAYWIAVEPGDLLHFPGYPYFISGNGLDAIASGYVALGVCAGLAAWLACEVVNIRRGSSRAWARGAAAFGLGCTAGGCLLGASAGFLFDLPRFPALLIVVIGLFGFLLISGFIVFPAGRQAKKLRRQQKRAGRAGTV